MPVALQVGVRALLTEDMMCHLQKHGWCILVSLWLSYVTEEALT